jgi:hypothetical protein
MKPQRKKRRPRAVRTGAPTLSVLGLRLGLPLLAVLRLKAEDQAAYRHEWYQEHDGRVEVQTDSVLIQKILAPWLQIRAEGVYDAISGATPIGVPPPDQITLVNPFTGQTMPGANIRRFEKATGPNAVSGASTAALTVPTASTLPLAATRDIRRAMTADATFNFGPHHLTPEFSYSTEQDYISVAPALNYSLDLNQKNTTLNLGWAHAADRILPTPSTIITTVQHKTSDDFLAGITQVLGPKTLLVVNGIFGHGEGYFNDPYKVVIFQSVRLTGVANDTITVFGEQRPTVRNKATLYASLTQAIPSLNASIEGSYRFYYDSFGIYANTVTLAWFQKVGSWLVISPSFRFYRQDAAYFYATQFPGDPILNGASVPHYYSSDYRLSALDSFTFGIQATARLKPWLSLEAGYQRYVMQGRDGVTTPSTYPTADIATIGLTIWF